MSSNFKSHSNYQPLQISESAAGKWAHFSWFPQIFKYLELWVGLEPLWAKHSYTEMLLVAQECGILPGCILFSPGQFPTHVWLLWHLWQAAAWPSLSPQTPQLSLPLSCFVTLGHSEFPVPRHRVRRAPLSYSSQREEKKKILMSKGALASLAGRHFTMYFSL